MANKKYVIYSAVVGYYDEIFQPEVIDDRFDYVLFSSDVKKSRIGIWQVRPIDYYNPDSTRICRYIKTHPEEFFPEYEASIWIDSNIRICTSFLYEHSIDLCNQGILFSSMWHWNECIYKEAFSLVNMMIEHEEVVARWCHHLRKEGYPQRIGLCETGVMFRKHGDKLTHQADELWWWCIDNYSRRDQLSFNYVLWKLGIPLYYFLGKGYNVRNSEHFSIIKHINTTHNQCSIGKNEAWLMRYCWKDKTKEEIIERVYYKLYGYPFTICLLKLMGQYYRVKYLIENYGK